MASKGGNGRPDAPAPSKKASHKRPTAKAASLYRAYRTNRSIEGKVQRIIKGGYEINLGGTRGFCPHSQMDLRHVDEPESFIGQSLLFRITQVRRGGADVVLSRRSVLEEEQKDEAKAVRATLLEGAVMQGRVAGLAEFGAFVDLGAGVMGLVHVSELSHSRVTRVGDAVKVGDRVTAKILKIDESRGRISLSLRQAQEDPWSAVAEKVHVGEVHPGKVQRVTDFGAFVELAPGVEALAPAGELPPSRTGWRDKIQPGVERDWLVLSVDVESRRISLTIPVEGTNGDPLPPIEAGASLSGQVQRLESYGVFVWLGPGRVGLMPKSLCGLPPHVELERRFGIGDPIEVQVVDVQDGGRRIRLSARGVDPRLIKAEGEAKPRRRRPDRMRERRSDRAPAGKTFSEAPNAFGQSLGDKLRAALGQSEDGP